ncbi:MAG: hypothetical protein JWO97_2777 [Acidobacteria bacterium]|nr:hypothetical protein [Acidobacteriota bacterium]
MHARAAILIDELRLERHPEGGWYRQTFRSGANVIRGADERSALTAIYFLLVRGERSQWHRVASDEVWTHLEGSAITLWQSERSDLLAPLAEGGTPFLVVPRGEWQSAETMGDYTLVACFVAPGFEFADFEMRATSPRG